MDFTYLLSLSEEFFSSLEARGRQLTILLGLALRLPSLSPPSPYFLSCFFSPF